MVRCRYARAHMSKLFSNLQATCGGSVGCDVAVVGKEQKNQIFVLINTQYETGRKSSHFHWRRHIVVTYGSVGRL